MPMNRTHTILTVYWLWESASPMSLPSLMHLITWTSGSNVTPSTRTSPTHSMQTPTSSRSKMPLKLLTNRTLVTLTFCSPWAPSCSFSEISLKHSNTLPLASRSHPIITRCGTSMEPPALNSCKPRRVSEPINLPLTCALTMLEQSWTSAYHTTIWQTSKQQPIATWMPSCSSQTLIMYAPISTQLSSRWSDSTF